MRPTQSKILILDADTGKVLREIVLDSDNKRYSGSDYRDATADDLDLDPGDLDFDIRECPLREEDLPFLASSFSTRLSGLLAARTQEKPKEKLTLNRLPRPPPLRYAPSPRAEQATYQRPPARGLLKQVTCQHYDRCSRNLLNRYDRTHPKRYEPYHQQVRNGRRPCGRCHSHERCSYTVTVSPSCPKLLRIYSNTPERQVRNIRNPHDRYEQCK